jgi:hypothetical protein
VADVNVSDNHPTLHPDFVDVQVTPGESHITGRHELFDIVNLITFGGAADRRTHVPAELGRIGPVALWESTGAADQLPFWNTNCDGDAYLYVVHGSVRVEFKETDAAVHYGHYLARTGDLLRLPKDVAHRTFSGDGKRRISLEIMPENPYWALLGQDDIAPNRSGRVGGFTFTGAGEHVVVSASGCSARCPRAFFVSALHALSKYELHLGHNELDGGFTVHDLGDRVVLSVPGHEEELDAPAVLAVFRGLLDHFGP